jgi:hypothetical protein
MKTIDQMIDDLVVRGVTTSPTRLVGAARPVGVSPKGPANIAAWWEPDIGSV